MSAITTIWLAVLTAVVVILLAALLITFAALLNVAFWAKRYVRSIWGDG